MTKATMVDGLASIESTLGPIETMDGFETQVRALGMTVFARIDHAAGAAAAGMELRPMELLIFGNPQAGSSLMAAKQTVGIDLPLKVLVWQDDAGVTRLSWNDPVWLARRHGIGGDAIRVVEKMSEVVKAIAGKAAGR